MHDMTKIFCSQKDIIPNTITHIVSDIDGVLTTDDKKKIAIWVTERLKILKEYGLIIIANTLRWYSKYWTIIQWEIQDIIDFWISERWAICITNNKKIIPLIDQKDIDEIKICNNQIEKIIISKWAEKWAGPYTCVQYYFADNDVCNKIVEEVKLDYGNITLEATGQKSIVLTKKGVDKWFAVKQLLMVNQLQNTLVLWDDKVDESMFLIPWVLSFNVGNDKTLKSSYITSEKWYKATIQILDQLIYSLQNK